MEKIVDFHSHVLPGMDDGSRNIATSLRMLRAIINQGVQVQVLTPHYYAWQEDIPRFLRRREHSYQRLAEVIPPEAPELICGAEVAYYPHMSLDPQLSGLRIGNSDALLVEMPFESWTSDVMDEVAALSLDRGFRVVLAHVERFLPYKGNAEMLDKIARLPVTFQINAEILLHITTRGGALRLAKSKKPLILGSDAHGDIKRPPNLAEGRRMIEKKLGKDYLHRMDEAACDLLWGGQPEK